MRPQINFLRRVKHYTCGSTGIKRKRLKKEKTLKVYNKTMVEIE